MAFPTRSRTSQLFTTAATSYSVTLPSLDSGDLILIFATVRVGAPSAPTGFTQIATYGVSGFATTALFAKLSDGSETSAVITNASSSVCISIVYKVSGWGGTLATDIDNVSSGDNSSSPPAMSVTAGWGADDNLVLSFIGAGDDSQTFTEFPSGFSNTFQAQTDTGGNASVEVASCENEVTTDTATISGYIIESFESHGQIALIIKPGSSGGGATGPNTPINPSITSLLATSARLNWEQG
jgi:hypothetical protein